MPPLDDGHLSPGTADPRQWVCALAYLKAHAAQSVVASGADGAGGRSGIVLGADTIVLKGDQIIGKPEDADDARRTLRALSDGEHQVITGVAILPIGKGGGDGGLRTLWSDSATVRVGHLSDERVEAHVASGAWRGKAGGYNIVDQLAYSWPITFDGDITTVMGLPMRRLSPWLMRAMDDGGHARSRAG